MANEKKKKSSVSKKTKPTKKVVQKVAKKPEKTTKSTNKNMLPFIIAIVIVGIIAIVIALMSNKTKKANIESVQNIEVLNEKLNAKIVPPQNTKSVTYSIENNNIARIEYSKEFEDGYTMDLVLKSSSATEDLVEYDNDFGSIAIKMTTICNDGSDIEVTSYVAVDDTTIMKSEWYDNDMYYAMTTENLSTREDFLQEVNRVIIDNHVVF